MATVFVRIVTVVFSITHTQISKIMTQTRQGGRKAQGFSPRRPTVNLDSVYTTLVMIKTHYKIIKTGHYIEVYDYQNPVPVTSNKHILSNSNLEGLDYSSEENRKLNAKKSSLRAISKMKRLILGNMYFQKEIPKFISLTFDPKIHPKADSIDYTNYFFHLFRQRLNYHFNRHVEYIAVPERQKNGNWHYHMLAFNLPYISDPQILLENKIWQGGGTNVKAVYKTLGTHSYITKYMTKTFEDVTLFHRKRYFQTLKHQPVKLDQPEEASAIYSSLIVMKPLKSPQVFKISNNNGDVLNMIIKREYLVASV